MSKNEKSKDLSMAYGISKRKKYAKGGQIPPSAKTEKRPSPDQRGEETARNSGDKAPHMDKATSQPERKQSMRGPMTTKIKHPSMAQSPVFKIRLRDEEDDMMASDAPMSPEDEIREPMAKGGNVMKPERYAVDQGTSSQGHAVRRANRSNDFAKHPEASDRKIQREMGREDNETAKMRAYDRIKESRNVAEGPSKKPLQGLAEGGEIDGGEEESMDHDSSLVDAIMARRDQLHDEIDSGAHDLDSAVKMAEGGMADIEMNGEEEPNDFDDRNEDILKENYDEDMEDISEPKDSNEHGRHIMSDENDMVEKIRNKRRQR